MSTESTASTETWQLRRSYSSYEPISMIPAGGWQAVYAYRGVIGGRYAHAHSLVALVLAEEEWVTVHENGRRETTQAGRRIVGYDPDAHGIISPASEANNFIAYLAPGVPIPDSMERAAKEYVLSHESESESASESTEPESTSESP